MGVGESISGAFACRKSLFDTFDENLRIFIEQEEDCGLLKISQLSGRNVEMLEEASAFDPVPVATFTFDVLSNVSKVATRVAPVAGSVVSVYDAYNKRFGNCWNQCKILRIA